MPRTHMRFLVFLFIKVKGANAFDAPIKPAPLRL
jgi:hypothetical protein